MRQLVRGAQNERAQPETVAAREEKKRYHREKREIQSQRGAVKRKLYRDTFYAPLVRKRTQLPIDN